MNDPFICTFKLINRDLTAVAPTGITSRKKTPRLFYLGRLRLLALFFLEKCLKYSDIIIYAKLKKKKRKNTDVIPEDCQRILVSQISSFIRKECYAEFTYTHTVTFPFQLFHLRDEISPSNNARRDERRDNDRNRLIFASPRRVHSRERYDRGTRLESKKADCGKAWKKRRNGRKHAAGSP